MIKKTKKIVKYKTQIAKIQKQVFNQRINLIFIVEPEKVNKQLLFFRTTKKRKQRKKKSQFHKCKTQITKIQKQVFNQRINLIFIVEPEKVNKQLLFFRTTKKKENKEKRNGNFINAKHKLQNLPVY